MTRRNARWLVQWSPAMINPALGGSERLAVVHDWPIRAPILGAHDALLTSGGSQVTVGVVGSRIQDRASVSADLLGAGASATEVRSAFAQATAHPDFLEPVFAISRLRFDALKRAAGNDNVYRVAGTEFRFSSSRHAITPDLAVHVVGAVGPITADQLRALGSPYDPLERLGRPGSKRPPSAGWQERRPLACKCSAQPEIPSRRSRPFQDDALNHCAPASIQSFNGLPRPPWPGSIVTSQSSPCEPRRRDSRRRQHAGQ